MLLSVVVVKVEYVPGGNGIIFSTSILLVSIISIDGVSVKAYILS